MVFPWASIRSAVCWCLLFLLIPGSADLSEPAKKRRVVSGRISMPQEAPQPAATLAEPVEPETDSPAVVMPADSGDQSDEATPEQATPAAEQKPAPTPQEPAAGPRVVRKSVTLPQPEEKAPAAALPSPPDLQPAPLEAAPPVSDTAPSEPPAPAEPPPAPLQAKGIDPGGEESPPLPMQLPSILSGDKDNLGGIATYNPEGKIDPFEPLFKAKPDAPKKIVKKKRPKRIPRTPLEMVDISQLKLSAIISAPSGSRALVEEASGKGYVIRKGTPIGIHWGKVADIKKDRVIVEEEVQNLMGDYVKRKREMKLNKPIGE